MKRCLTIISTLSVIICDQLIPYSCNDHQPPNCTLKQTKNIFYEDIFEIDIFSRHEAVLKNCQRVLVSSENTYKVPTLNFLRKEMFRLNAYHANLVTQARQPQ